MLVNLDLKNLLDECICTFNENMKCMDPLNLARRGLHCLYPVDLIGGGGGGIQEGFLLLPGTPEGPCFTLEQADPQLC